MSFKLFLCKIGFHKWFYYKRSLCIEEQMDMDCITGIMECRRCMKCERIQESVFGHTWEGRHR
jgi:hypothetical protein